MTLENAIITAAQAAGRLDLPAYVFCEHNDVPTFQVAAVRWENLTDQQREALHTIVTPDGGVFEFQRDIR